MERKSLILGFSAITIFGYTNSNDSKMNKEKNEKFQSGYAPVGGLKMYYEIHGTGGMPLVLIHGGGSTIETSFGNILPLLASHREVIAVELQAHGHTSDRDSALSFEQDADDVAGLLQYLKINKADFLGFSNGGNTAMQIGIRHPAVVNKLVIASSFYKRDGFIPGFFEGLQHATLENMPKPLQTAYLKVAADKNHLKVMHDKDKERMLQFKDWSDDDMRSIKAPTLLIIGDHDVVKPEYAVEMSHIIPQAQLMIVPGDHGSYIGEVCSVKPDSKIPALTVSVIEEFLNSQ
jgi:pimeloyl-ACP methyl ester carboxylesterase